MKREIKFVKVTNGIPVIRFFTENSSKEQYAILDTGSEISMFDSNFVKSAKKEFNIKVTEHKINMIGVGADSNVPIVNCAGKVKLKCEGDNIYFLEFDNAMVFALDKLSNHITNEKGKQITVSAIFGNDLLNTIKAKIDYENRMLVINTDK